MSSFIPFRDMPCGGGASEYPQPFDVNITTSGNNGVATITPGTVNGVFPTNWTQSFNLSTSNVVYGYIQAQTNGTNVTSALIKIDNAYNPSQTPINNGLPTSFQYAFALISGIVPYRVMGGGSIIAWGETQYIQPVSDPSSLQPGQLPYETFNVWVVKAEGDPRLIR